MSDQKKISELPLYASSTAPAGVVPAVIEGTTYKLPISRLLASGGISSVNGVGPDGTGTVTLVPSNIGAEPSANKSTSTADSASTIKFPVWSAILAYFNASRIRTILGITTLSGSNTGDENADSIAKINHNTAEKTTLVDADELTGQNSANTFSLIRVTCLNLYNYLKTKFDLVYTPQTLTVNAKALSSNITLNTDDISEGLSPTNRWWTNARTIAATLTGYASGAGVVAATDTILQAIQKLNGNIAALVTGVSSVNTKTGAVTLVAADISGAAQNLINDGALSTGITGSTSEQPFTTIYTIAAGAVGSNVCANLMTRFTKTGTAGTMRIKLYVNSVASHTNGTQQLIADYSLSAGNVWLPIDRLLTFTGSNLIVSNVANTTATDSVNNTNAATSVTLNTANTWYLIQTVTLGSAADTANRRAIILRF